MNNIFSSSFFRFFVSFLNLPFFKKITFCFDVISNLQKTTRLVQETPAYQQLFTFSHICLILLVNSFPPFVSSSLPSFLPLSLLPSSPPTSFSPSPSSFSLSLRLFYLSICLYTHTYIHTTVINIFFWIFENKLVCSFYPNLQYILPKKKNIKTIHWICTLNVRDIVTMQLS